MWYSEASCSVQDFQTIISKETRIEDVRCAAFIEKNVPVYDASVLRNHLASKLDKNQLLQELGTILRTGAGVFVVKRAFADTTPIDQATDIFNIIIAEERDGMGGDDHFAEAGANDRIWNALEKLCLKAPRVFAQYYANDIIALASLAWLGPAYQMTSQINVVRPGSPAQQPHCDYHLGFLPSVRATLYPAHVHQLSAVLTLQGAIAHCDMPIESGPTKILPYSQTYGAGYVAWRREDFREFFETHYIQLELEKGDAVFLNPALFHAAGANTTQDTARMANLLQVSSAFGRPMEVVNRDAMSAALYPVLVDAYKAGQMTMDEISNAVASCAEGYAFPANLDEEPPADGLAPKTQQERMMRSLQDDLGLGSQ